MTFLGIDFSGNAHSWTPGCSRSNVWISTLAAGGGRLIVADLRRVQEIPGDGHPFARLARLLAAGGFRAAGIDAPFCIPAENLPPGGWPALAAAVDSLPVADGRPFPAAADFIRLATARVPKASAKPLRAAEQIWRDRGVNTRSTLWGRDRSEPRGGAAFAAACLKLLARSGCPCWPWSPPCDGMLAEAFPAAQLSEWGLPSSGYGKPAQTDIRRAIVEAMSRRVDFGEHEAAATESPDALDAVIAAFAGVAARQGLPPAQASQDGWIAVDTRPL